MDHLATRIKPVLSDSDRAAALQLFIEYAQFLGVDLSFQDFDDELASLPGKYAPPMGAILLARGLRGEPLGCIALRPILPAGCCEMKRLYVRPEGRGSGLGKALVIAIIKQAERIGYRTMRLDSLPSLDKAIGLYRQEGFVDTEAYYDNPIPDVVFMERSLDLGA